jgi:hypothetical protein
MHRDYINDIKTLTISAQERERERKKEQLCVKALSKENPHLKEHKQWSRQPRLGYCFNIKSFHCQNIGNICADSATCVGEEE